ncbi:MAG: hypothetical protein ABGX47_25245 [Martelella sp.]|uniref:hypothetical protein n=1 Tax=Martelella sp. TaxID=1969699 RepID=UPI00324224FF
MDYSVCLCKQLFYGWNNDLDSMKWEKGLHSICCTAQIIDSAYFLSLCRDFAGFSRRLEKNANRSAGRGTSIPAYGQTERLIDCRALPFR